MASNHDRFPSQPLDSSFADERDSTRLHPSLSNSISDDGRNQRSRGSSISQQNTFNPDSSRFQQARQPINDAVTSALNSADPSSTAAFPPDLLQHLTSQITANVLNHLKGASMPLPPDQPQMSGPHPDTSSSTAGSPPLGRSTVYTPPSPYRTSEDTGAGQASPQFPQPSTQSSFRTSSPPAYQRTVSPLSQGSHLSEGEATQTRPRGPRRISTGGDATILERVWGTLFTEQGQATPRLGQFLRGIAVHLIEDYEPKNSLVITPTKLQRYYEETKLPSELYPWKMVFDDRTSSISRMFREIEAEHHLVQDKLNERPDIPGLTPHGFETLATLLLKAHPDQEFERLAKTALDMPISNPDEKRERFPKELSRRLFPAHPDTEIVDKLQKAMSAHCNVNFTSRHSSAAETSPRASQSFVTGDELSQKTAPKSSPDKAEPPSTATEPNPGLSQSGIERQRQPYTGKPEGVIFEDSDDTPTPQPIERERKPYAAAPGGGKYFDNNNIDKTTAAAAGAGAAAGTMPEFKPPPPPPYEGRPGRSNSVHAANRTNERFNPNPIAIHQRPPPPPMDIPDTRNHRFSNSYHRDLPRPGRNRSPSMSKDGGSSSYARRSEPDASFLSSSHHSDQFDDGRRYKEYEAQRERQANDRYDAARMTAYDPRERERDRDGRPRMQSVSAFDEPSNTRGPAPLSTSGLPSEEDYYLSRTHSASVGSYGAHSMPTSISTGFQPPPPPPISARESSTSANRDSIYGSYPLSAGYPPTSYRDMR